MARSSRTRRVVTGSALALVVSLLAAACGMIAGLDGLNFFSECVSAANCDDHDPCTSDICDADAGVCAHASAPVGTACDTDGGHVCDGEGRCVACNTDKDCPGNADDCQRPACTAYHTCGSALTAAGTPVKTKPMQIPGDCHVLQCDGQGGFVTQVDDGDLPDDADDCTEDHCSQGAPSHTTLAPGTPCGDGTLKCDQSGKCKGCTKDTQCTPPQTCGGSGSEGVCGCAKKTCAELGKRCGTWPDGCGGVVTCDDGVMDDAETDIDCGGPSCASCVRGKKCKVNVDCAAGLLCAEGVCCDSACSGPCQSCALPTLVGTCSPIAAQDKDPLSGCTCDGAGKCLLSLDQGCDSGAQCMSGNCINNLCKLAVLDACDAGKQCASGVCKYNMICKLPAGEPCDAGKQCYSNYCKDGVCCISSCTAECRACNLPMSEGKCSIVPAGTMCDGGTCMSDGTCQ